MRRLSAGLPRFIEQPPPLPPAADDDAVPVAAEASLDREARLRALCRFCKHGAAKAFKEGQLRYAGIWLHAYQYECRSLAGGTGAGGGAGGDAEEEADFVWNAPFPEWAIEAPPLPGAAEGGAVEGGAAEGGAMVVLESDGDGDANTRSNEAN